MVENKDRGFEEYYKFKNSGSVLGKLYCDGFLQGYHDGFQWEYINHDVEIIKELKDIPEMVDLLKKWVFDRDLEFIDDLTDQQCMMVYYMFLEGLSLEEIKLIIDMAETRKRALWTKMYKS